MDRMSEIPGMLSLVWKGPLAGVWRIIDRKFRRRPQGRNVLLSISGCIACVSCDSAGVIRLEVLFSMGSRLCRGFAIPGKWHLYPCDVFLNMKSMKRHEGLAPETWV
jgi:hypothetical protein